MKNKRPPKLDKIRQEAISRIAKTEQLQIRLDRDLWDALYKLAGQRRLHVSSMVREWIKDRSDTESGVTSERRGSSKTVEKRIDKLCKQQHDTQKLLVAVCASMAAILEQQTLAEDRGKIRSLFNLNDMIGMVQDDEIRSEFDKIFSRKKTLLIRRKAAT